MNVILLADANYNRILSHLWQSATPPSILAVLLCLAYLAKGLKKQCSAFTRINFPPLARVAHVSASNSDAVFVMQSGEVCSYLTFIQLV